jgi:hypothetical protein
VAARSKARVCGSSLAGNAGLNIARGMNVYLLCVLFVVRYRCLRQADRSSKGVLPSVVCLSMIIIPRQQGDPGPLGCCAKVKQKIGHSKKRAEQGK